MEVKKLRVSALICLIFTVLWLILMLLSVSKTGPINTFEQAIDSIINTGILFQLSYVNAVMVTITVTIFFVVLYNHYRKINQQWALIGITFIPAYCILNLLVYFSQITVVPRLANMINTSEYSEVYKVILGQFIQGWSGSTISVLNQLAYGILGISSIVFGWLIVKDGETRSSAGWMLILNGLACFLGVIGTGVNNQILAAGSVLGGGLFIISLIAIVFSTKISNQSINLNKESNVI